MMKKLKWQIFMMCVVLFAFAGMYQKQVQAGIGAIDTGTVSIETGSKTLLKTTVTKGYKLPTVNKAYRSTVAVKSSNKKIATVNKYGIVTGKKAGKVKITISSKGYRKGKHTWSVVVKKKIPDKDKFIYNITTDETGNSYITITDYIGYDLDVIVPASIDNVSVKIFSARLGSPSKPEYRRNIRTITFENGITEISAYSMSEMEDLQKVVLPETLEKLGKKVFQDSARLKEVNMVEIFDLGYIPECTFSGCANLSVDITIPGNVTKIEAAAFSSSGLKSVVLSEGIKEIGNSAFYYTKISEIIIPSTVEKIGTKAFAYNNFNQIIMLSKNAQLSPDAFNESSVEIGKIELANGTFKFQSTNKSNSITKMLARRMNPVDTGTVYIEKGRKTLLKTELTKGYKLPAVTNEMYQSTVKVKSSNKKIATVNKYGVVTAKKPGKVKITISSTGYIKGKHTWTVVVKKKITVKEQFLYTVKKDESGKKYIDITNYIGYDMIVNVPAKINNIPVKIYSASSGMRSNEKYKRNIKEINFKNGITEIGSLSYLEELEKVTLPKTLEKVSTYMFSGDIRLSQINMQEIFDLGYVPEGTFYGCENLAVNVSIPGNVTKIERYAFSSSGIKSVSLSEGLKEIEDYAFVNMNLPEIVIPSTVNSIGNEAFFNSKFQRIIIFAKDVNMSPYAFYKSKVRIGNAELVDGELKFQSMQGFTTMKYE